VRLKQMLRSANSQKALVCAFSRCWNSSAAGDFDSPGQDFGEIVVKKAPEFDEVLTVPMPACGMIGGERVASTEY